MATKKTRLVDGGNSEGRTKTKKRASKVVKFADLLDSPDRTLPDPLDKRSQRNRERQEERNQVRIQHADGADISTIGESRFVSFDQNIARPAEGRERTTIKPGSRRAQIERNHEEIYLGSDISHFFPPPLEGPDDPVVPPIGFLVAMMAVVYRSRATRTTASTISV